MILRPFLFEPTACASYLLGCPTHRRLAVVDPHVEMVDEYLAAAERIGIPIVAVLETHVQADHVSGMGALVAATGASAHLPAGAGVELSPITRWPTARRSISAHRRQQGPNRTKYR